MPSLTTLNCPACNKPISPGTKFCASCGHQLVEPETGEAKDPLIGQFVGGRFLVQAKLGEGGMGAVYQAEQVAMKRPVALKVLHPHLCQDDDLIERFHREAAAASRLNHPNTITVHDFGQTDEGTLYIAMEFIGGRSLAEEGETLSSLPWSRSVHIALQIAESLADAHAAGIVHRDLKPDNVMLLDRAGSTDFVKILDFGIAKIADAAEADGDKRKALTKTGMIFGTPQYMSPEQIRGTGVDHRTDVYALGVILYQLLTGELPFTAENPMGMLTKHLMEPPRPMAQVRQGIDVPPQLEALTMKCLEKDPDSRYQSMMEIVPELGALAGDTRPGFAVQTPAPVAGVAAVAAAQQPLGTGAFGDQTPPPTAVLETTPPPVSGPGSFGGQVTPGPGGFAQPSTGGLTPPPVGASPQKSGGAGKTILLVIIILLLLAGAGVGGVFAWRSMSEDDDDDTDVATTVPTVPTVPTTPTIPTVPTTPTVPTVPTTPTVPTVPTKVPDAGAAVAAPDAGKAAPDAGAPLSEPGKCKVVPAGKRSESLAKALEVRESQLRLCLNPLLSRDFDGELKMSYRWGRGKGPNRFKASKNSLGDKTVATCFETVVKMASHPSSKRTTKGRFHLLAKGGGGKLQSCLVTLGVPARRRKKGGGPKPPGWPAGTPYPGYPTYPGGGYPGYGGY